MVINTIEELQNIIPLIEKMELVGVDTETTGVDPFNDKVIMLQIGNLEKQFIIDTRSLSIEPLRKILESNKPKVLHNAKFDYKMIRGSFNIKMENMIDTMIIEMVLTNGLKHSGFSLKDLVQKYLKEDISKDLRSSFLKHSGEFTEEQIEYAKNDIIYPIRVLMNQMPHVIQEKLEYVVKLECLAVAAFGDLEYNGIFLDKNKWNDLVKDAIIQRDKAKEKLDEIFKKNNSSTDLFGYIFINYDSEQQLKEALAKIGIIVENTSKEVLSKINNEVIKLILEYRKHQKVITTYGNSFLKHIHPKTNRIHCTFRQLGAESGRVSCTTPNLQNIKAGSDFRNSFRAESGKKIITADYSGCELRIIAEGSKDSVFIKTFKEGGDLHSIVASTMFKCNVSKDENANLRKAAKSINFGLAYGMGAGGLSQIVGGNAEEAEKLLKNYFKNYPQIAAFLEKSARFAVENGYSITMAGRKRYYKLPENPDDFKAMAAIERKGKNTPIQGTNADMIKLALVWMRKAIISQNLDAKIINTVHDEIVVECEESIVNQVEKLIKDTMILSGEEFIKSVPTEVDCTVADFWTK